MKSRFQRELSGELGTFWQRQAEAELERVKVLPSVFKSVVFPFGVPIFALNGDNIKSILSIIYTNIRGRNCVHYAAI